MTQDKKILDDVITDEHRELITSGEIARVSMVKVCDYFKETKNLSEDEFWRIMDEVYLEFKEYFEK